MPAIIALIIYALLPIVRNTITALDSVPAASLEASRSLGFTSWQTLRLIEIPLTLPIILAGIRTASVMCVGIATIAAFIGAGGLGDFIYQGLSLNDNHLILLGAIPAAIMALLFDYIIGYLEKHLSSRKKGKTKPAVFFWIIVFIGFVLVVSVIFTVIHKENRKAIVIGSKNFTEQFILGNIMADMIEDHSDIKVIKKFNLGSTMLLQGALERGEVDLYPEYTGTAYLVILKDKYNPSITEKQLYNTVKTQYLKRYHLAWLKPFGFQNSQAIATTQSVADDFKLNAISDLQKLPHLSIAAPMDSIKRPDGFQALANKYQLHFSKVVPLVPDLMYKAIAEGRVNTIMAFTTDGRIKAYHLKLLQDNKHAFPPYYAAPVIREATLRKYPELKSILNSLAGKISNKEMMQMNYEVNVGHELPEKVAKDFLISKHLIRA